MIRCRRRDVRSLVDTNVVSELRQHGARSPSPSVLAWSASVDTDDVGLSAVTLLELHVGVLRVERRDPPAGAVLRIWLDDHVRPGFEGRVLAVTPAVAVRAAPLHVPNPASQHDALIGATALVHGLTMVTRNVRDFERFDGLDVLDPWAWSA